MMTNVIPTPIKRDGGDGDQQRQDRTGGQEGRGQQAQQRSRERR